MGNIHTTATTRNWQWVFTAGSEGIVRKYDFFGSMNGKQVLRQQQQRHGFIDSLTKGGVLLSSWENDTPRSTSMFVYNNKVQIPPIFCSAVHSEGLWLLTGQKNPLVDKSQPVTADVPVKLWTVRIYEGRCMHEFRHHKATVSAIALEPDEQAFVSGSWDKTVQVRNKQDWTFNVSLRLAVRSAYWSGHKVVPCTHIIRHQRIVCPCAIVHERIAASVVCGIGRNRVLLGHAPRETRAFPCDDWEQSGFLDYQCTYPPPPFFFACKHTKR